MRIAILGGGMTGLAAAHTISKDTKHTITVFEGAQTLGGLASGFWGQGWQWPLERAYHHIFSSDKHIISFLSALGYKDIVFSKPITASLYRVNNEYKTFAVDTPLDLLRFPLLSILDKIRAGIVLGFFKISPFLGAYEQLTTENILRSTMGKEAFETLFGEMFRKKFGKYAGNILASFIWSRIHMRTKSLGYMRGGFQRMVDFVGEKCRESGVSIQLQKNITSIRVKEDKTLSLATNEGEVGVYDIVISTIPSPILAQVTRGVLTPEERDKLTKIHHLGAVNLIVEMDTAIFDREYWVSICTPDIPSLVFVQHTNFVDKSQYGGHHLLYIASYCEDEDPRMSMSKEELFALYLPTLQKITNKQFTVLNLYSWKAQHAQPIFDRDFLSVMPHFTTSNPRFYIANLDMTYPFDRGTNYAVRLGIDVGGLVLASTGV